MSKINLSKEALTPAMLVLAAAQVRAGVITRKDIVAARTTDSGAAVRANKRAKLDELLALVPVKAIAATSAEFRMSGAELRALNTRAAKAEIARRAAKRVGV